MNTTVRNLIAAIPLAAAAVTMTPALAMADGPVIVLSEPGPVDPDGPGEIAQPEVDPEPHPQPAPHGPDDKDGPTNDDDPQNPDDKDGPKNDEPVDPDGPGGITNPDPCPTHGGGPECTPDEPTQPTEPTQPAEPEIEVQSSGGLHPQAEVKPVVLPTRVDAGLAPATEDGGLNLAWTLAGGALVTASGAAFAARRIRSKA